MRTGAKKRVSSQAQVVVRVDHQVARARVFWTGNSQAVRLPKEFRIQADEVRIRREGNHLVLEPLPVDGNGWPLGWRRVFGAGGDAPLDLGNRRSPPERKAPLGR